MAFRNAQGLSPFPAKVCLSSPTMHGEEAKYMMEAYDTNWMSTIGKNLTEVESQVAAYLGSKHVVALNAGTSALHLATRLAGETLYGRSAVDRGSLTGHVVLASDMTFDASINPIAYENGNAIFVDTEYDTWNMDPEALEKAFTMHPEAKLVVLAHLYGTPAKISEIRDVCRRHGALIVEDAAESLGAKVLIDGKWVQTGLLGNYGCISFNGNKIITGSCGGMFLSESAQDAEKVRKWSTQSRENAPWYQHEEIGYNYRMSNVVAGVIRGQLPHIQEHIDQKRAIYERYREGFRDLPVRMNPYDEERSIPNFWLSCMLIDESAMCVQVRGDLTASFVPESGKSCPTEILETLASYNAEGRPIWKPMHMQPMYRNHEFVSLGNDVGADIFQRGLCLPSDNKMTPEQQATVIEIIHRCFD